MTVSTPDLAAEIKAALPPSAGADVGKVIDDLFATGQKVGNELIDQNAPHVPIFGKIAASIVKSAIDHGELQADNELKAWVTAQLKPQGA